MPHSPVQSALRLLVRRPSRSVDGVFILGAVLVNWYWYWFQYCRGTGTFLQYAETVAYPCCLSKPQACWPWARLKLLHAATCSRLISICGLDLLALAEWYVFGLWIVHGRSCANGLGDDGGLEVAAAGQLQQSIAGDGMSGMVIGSPLVQLGWSNRHLDMVAGAGHRPCGGYNSRDACRYAQCVCVCGFLCSLCVVRV
jgi:hypothetical protein